MEAVLGGGFGWDSQSFQVLSFQGQSALKMLFDVVFYVEQPYDDASRLEERAKAALNPGRLAALTASGQAATPLESTGS